MSNNVKTFCNAKGIEIVQSPVNDHRATGCVERAIGSLKNSISTYAQGETTRTLGENGGKSTRSIEIFTERDTQNNAIRGTSRQGGEHRTSKPN